MAIRIIGIFDDEEAAVRKIRELEKTGTDPAAVSVLARDEQVAESIADATEAEERHPGSERALGILSGFLTGISGGFIIPSLVVPGIGPLLAAGPLASTLEGDNGQELSHMFASIGIAEAESAKYADAVNEGKIILFIED